MVKVIGHYFWRKRATQDAQNTMQENLYSKEKTTGLHSLEWDLDNGFQFEWTGLISLIILSYGQWGHEHAIKCMQVHMQFKSVTQ